jgi:hypothetical protein
VRGGDGGRGGTDGGLGGGVELDVVVVGATVVVVVVVVVVVGAGCEASRVCSGETVAPDVGGSASAGWGDVAAGTIVACVNRMAAAMTNGRKADAARPQVRWDRNRAEAPCSTGGGDAECAS